MLSHPLFIAKIATTLFSLATAAPVLTESLPSSVQTEPIAATPRRYLTSTPHLHPPYVPAALPSESSGIPSLQSSSGSATPDPDPACTPTADLVLILA